VGTPIDLDKYRSVGVIGRRTRDHIREGRDDTGQRWKATTDQLGNTVTVRGDNRQDVHINAPAVTYGLRQETR
jgi:hypothetical protein